MHSAGSHLLSAGTIHENAAGLVYLRQPAPAPVLGIPMSVPIPVPYVLLSETMPTFTRPTFYPATPPMALPVAPNNAVQIIPQVPLGGLHNSVNTRQHTQAYPPLMAGSAPLVMMMPTASICEKSGEASLSYSRTPPLGSFGCTPSSCTSEPKQFLGVRGFLAPAPLGSRIAPDLPTHTTVPGLAVPRPKWGILPRRTP